MARPGKAQGHSDIDAEKSGESGLYDGFESYRTPMESEYHNLLTSGIIVPDTNVFLNLYRYNEGTRNDLLSVLRALGDRLWVPKQVIVEFWRNRDRVLQDPRNTEKTIQDLTAQRDGTIAVIHSWVNRIGLSNERRSYFDSIVSSAFDSLVADVKKFVDNDAVEFARDTTRDPVLAELEKMLIGRVGKALDKSEYQAALQEAKRRAELKIPPGYKDIGKSGDGPAGDYLIWAQILKEIRRQPRDILIVTGDAKEDWWRRERGELRGPRPELAEEVDDTANVRLFMMRPESLLLLARKFLRISVRDESVEDIEQIDQYLEEKPRPSIETIREFWPDILRDMKSRSRVGGIVLSAARPVSLNDDLLTLEFPRRGDVKGWTSSRYDQMLIDIIEETLGIEVHTGSVVGSRATGLSPGYETSDGRQAGKSSEDPSGYADEPPF